MDEEVLESMYREELDERLILHLAEVTDLPLEKAMDLYYHSRMADMIGHGIYGIQYLDYKVLVEMMLDTEKDLFANYGFFRNLEYRAIKSQTDCCETTQPNCLPA